MFGTLVQDSKFSRIPFINADEMELALLADGHPSDVIASEADFDAFKGEVAQASCPRAGEAAARLRWSPTHGLPLAESDEHAAYATGH